MTLPQKRTDGTALAWPVTVEIYRRRFQKPSPTPAVSPRPTPAASPAGPPAFGGGIAVPAGPFEKIDELRAGAPQAAKATPQPRPQRRTPSPSAGTPSPSPTPAPVRLTYTDQGSHAPLEPGYVYLYQVVLTDEDGEPSTPSNTVQVEYEVVPGAPPAIAAQAGKDGVQLMWRAPTGDCTGAKAPPPDGYNVYRRADQQDFPAAPLNSSPVPETRYLDKAAELDRIYTYTVRAVTLSPRREGDRSKEVTVERYDLYPPAPPSGLVVTRTKEGVSLLWNPSPSEDVAGYHVYREQQGGWTRLTREPVAKTSHLDPQAGPRRRLRYRVTAVDRSIRANESVPSQEVAVDEP